MAKKMRFVKHTAAHPGFKAVAAGIKRRDPSIKNPNAVLAAARQKASPAAVKANPRLKRVTTPKKGR
jgi:hypothetical protein